jgi:xylono-1,5-lactonase
VIGRLVSILDDVRIVTRRHRAQLAEGPLWCAQENAVYWVDILGPTVYRLTLADGVIRSWPMPETICWLVERALHPGFIAGFAGGFAELTLDPLAIRVIGDPEPSLTNNRMNDAKVDGAGRIWAGTMDSNGGLPVGSLYRLDADHSWRQMDSGYFVTNGPTFSPDGRKLYHADSLRRVIYRFDLEPDGSLHNKIAFIIFDQESGLPDGMTTDADGCLWVAHWGGGRVSRVDSQGRIERQILLPVSQPTSCVFAGERLDRMFVTSAASDRPEEEFAGELFEIDTGARGLPAGRFAA